MATAIEFENIGKQYRLGLVSTRTLSHDLNRWWTVNVRGKEDPYLKIGDTNDRAHKGESDYVWALKDINFKVEQGDVVGIIGNNGAGKSTLLKLLSRVTAPTTGQIRARGRIGSLLEVGTGFHKEMTGRENIFMNGAILGMTKQEISSKLDEIVDFSGCERYLDTPVKRYSSGMMVRLGFAVAAHLDPEILVVDEVLAVGDAEFQKKAIGKMKDVSQGEGRTVLFVSHNMASIRALCKRGIVLKNGVVDFLGSADDCVSYYVDNNVSDLYSHVKIEASHHRFNLLHELEYTEATLLNDSFGIATDEPIRVKLHVKRNSRQVKEFQAGLLVNNSEDTRVGTFTAPMVRIPEGTLDEFDIVMQLNNHNLGKGRFYLDFNIGVKDFSKGVRDYDVIKNVLSFEVKYLTSKDKSEGQEYVLWSRNWGNCCFCDGSVEIV